MKCPHCRWTGPFKSFGGHMAAKHRRIMLKNLKKAHTPAARAKAAATRRRKASGVSRSPGKGKRGHHTRGKSEGISSLFEDENGTITIVIRR